MDLRQDEYDVVLIIGNGFDLNLGLKTGYCDFIESHFFTDLLTQNNQLCRHLADNHSLQGWIDIENELKKYSQKIVSDRSNIFYNEFKDLSNNLRHYLSEIDYDNIKKDRLAYRLIERVKDSTVLLINFNYTHTIRKICNDLGIDENDEYSNFEHIQIHGSIKDDDNIIFGVEDNARISPKHVFLKKSVNANFNSTDFSKEILGSAHFVVFGHSLGETDHMYFYDFFSKTANRVINETKQNISIYYYGEQGYHDIFAQIDELTNSRISKLKQHSKFVAIETKTMTNSALAGADL